jgi:putative tricarboxylic transport membrane protein
MPRPRARSARSIAIAFLAVPLAAACGSTSQDTSSLSGSTIRLVVPTAAGGGLDAVARQLVPSFSKELDAKISVENVDGGGYAIGTQSSLKGKQDCSTVLVHGIPHIGFSHLTQKVNYSLDSFAPVGVSRSIRRSFECRRTPNGRPSKT